MIYFQNFAGESADLDRFAVEHAGILGGGGRDCQLAFIPDAPEWGVIAINTQGTGNCGILVLTGLTPRTRALLREGKCRRLKGLGVADDVASIAVSRQYGNEDQVALLATRLVEVVRAKGPFQGHSRAQISRWAGEGICMSVPRALAAAAIAAEVVAAEFEKFGQCGVLSNPLIV